MLPGTAQQRQPRRMLAFSFYVTLSSLVPPQRGVVRGPAARLVGLLSGLGWLGVGRVGRRGLGHRQPDAHGPAVAVVPLEIGDGGDGGPVAGRLLAGAPAIRKPGPGRRWQGCRAGLDDDRVARAG